MVKLKLISFNINEAAEHPKAEELLQELRSLDLTFDDVVGVFTDKVEQLGLPMGRAFLGRVVGKGRAREVLEEYGDIKITPTYLWQAVQSLGESAKLVRVLDRPV